MRPNTAVDADAALVTSKDSSAVFGDLRVLELSEGITGPVVGMLFGDFGAHVIKVEVPSGDWARERPGFAVWNRNKDSVTVDQTSESDLRWLADSIRGADVCILGAGQELGFWGPEVEKAALNNPGLVTVRLPAYLDGFTPWVGDTESNGLLSAHGGYAARQSSFDGGPVDTVPPFMLYAQALWATTCSVAALVERNISGKGQTVTVTGVNGLMTAGVAIFSIDTDAGEPDTAIGPAGRHPVYRQFRCSDGKWIICGALGLKFETALLNALGIGDILSDPRINNDLIRMIQPENRDWCVARITAAFAERTSDEAIAIMNGLGIPTGRVESRDSWMDHPQVSAAGMRVDIFDPARGTVTMPGIPVKLTETPGVVRRPSPGLGEHNGSAAWSPRSVRSGDEDRLTPGPLFGLRVIDIGSFVASPYAGLLLAELGADVVKVEPVTGDPWRETGYTFNRGMRSLAVDLQSSSGLSAFQELVKISDVVIDGMRPGVTKRLGIDYDNLTKINPEIVTMSLSGFGEGGPLSTQPGVDLLMQGLTGLMSAQGGDDDPVGYTIAFVDTLTAVMSTLATVIAFYHRQLTGHGQRTWDSLAGTATFLQMEDLVRFDGRPAPRKGGRDFLGADVLHQFHKVSNGWIYLDEDPRAKQQLRMNSLLNLLGIPVNHGAHSTGQERMKQLSTALLELSGEEAVAMLNTGGMRATESRVVSSVIRDPQLIASDLVHIRPLDDGGTFVTPGSLASFSRTQRRGPMDPPGVGEHTEAVLREAGVSCDAVRSAEEAGAVHQGDRIVHRLQTAYR